MHYLYLLLAIVGELIGSSLLKASEGFSKLYPSVGVIVAFTFSFFFLSLSLKTIPLNTAYALWSGLGIIATTMVLVMVMRRIKRFLCMKKYRLPRRGTVFLKRIENLIIRGTNFLF